MTGSPSPHRPIRSYVRREGRMTAAQQRALETLWPKYGIGDGTEPRAAGRIGSPALYVRSSSHISRPVCGFEPDESPLDLNGVFGRSAPVTLEIGFGNGEALLAMAAAHPECDYLGIEVHRPGVGQLLNRLAADGISNVRAIIGDAGEFLAQRIPDGSLDAVHLFFPDPWPKQRHHKRRLVQPGFAALVRSKLKIGGVWHLATDWEDYAGQMRAVLEAAEGFENLAGAGCFAVDPGERPHTKFEQRGRRLGHGVWDLRYRRIA